MADSWHERRQAEWRKERVEVAAALRAWYDNRGTYSELATLLIRALRAGAFVEKAGQLLASQSKLASRLPEPPPPPESQQIQQLPEPPPPSESQQIRQLPERLRKPRRIRPMFTWPEVWCVEVLREVLPARLRQPPYTLPDQVNALADSIEPVLISAERAKIPEPTALVNASKGAAKPKGQQDGSFDTDHTPVGQTKHNEAAGSTPEEQRQPPDPAAARQAALESLEPADLKAYYTYAYAESKLGSTTDWQAYEWLSDNGLPDERDDPRLARELANYKLPKFATWSKQLRNARKMLGEQKHTRRAGRAAGSGSIVGSRELDKIHDAD